MDDMIERIEIYSVNKAVAVYMLTDIFPQFELRKETNLISFIFPKCNEVRAALVEFNNPECTVPIHKFIELYTDVRTQMKYFKNNVNK